LELGGSVVYNLEMRRTDSSGMNAIVFLIALNILAFVFRILRPELLYTLGLTPALVME